MAIATTDPDNEVAGNKRKVNSPDSIKRYLRWNGEPPERRGTSKNEAPFQDTKIITEYDTGESGNTGTALLIPAKCSEGSSTYNISLDCSETPKSHVSKDDIKKKSLSFTTVEGDACKKGELFITHRVQNKAKKASSKCKNNSEHENNDPARFQVLVTLNPSKSRKAGLSTTRLHFKTQEGIFGHNQERGLCNYGKGMSSHGSQKVYLGVTRNGYSRRRSSTSQFGKILRIFVVYISLASYTFATGVERQPQVLRKGATESVPFVLNWTIDQPPNYLYYTLGFEFAELPFCSHGEKISQGFKSAGQANRFEIIHIEGNYSLNVELRIKDVTLEEMDVYVLSLTVFGQEELSLSHIKDVVVYSPPGKAKCFIALKKNSDTLYEVHCHASTGDTPIVLSCFQNYTLLSYENGIHYNGNEIRAIFVAVYSAAVHCCSHDQDTYTTQKTCNHFAFNPYPDLESNAVTPASKLETKEGDEMFEDVLWEGTTDTLNPSSSDELGPFWLFLMFACVFHHFMI